MSDTGLWDGCPRCKNHEMTRVTIDLTFHQTTDRGRVTCCVAVPRSTCPRCGFEVIDADAERLMDEAVRQAYDKLPPRPPDAE